MKQETIEALEEFEDMLSYLQCEIESVRNKQLEIYNNAYDDDKEEAANKMYELLDKIGLM